MVTLARPRGGLSTHVLSGSFFIVVGALALAKSTDYRMGSVTQMGPGYFPACLSILLMLLGLVGVIRGLAGNGDAIMPWRIGQPALVIASVAYFGLVVDRWGLVPAVAGVIVISCLPRLRHRPIEILAMVCGLCLLTAVVFVMLLYLPFKLY